MHANKNNRGHGPLLHESWPPRGNSRIARAIRESPLRRRSANGLPGQICKTDTANYQSTHATQHGKVIT